MSDKKFRKGPKLFSLARKRALILDVPQEKGVCRIQAKEGNAPCFQQRERCKEMSCCWQASCTAVMEDR